MDTTYINKFNARVFNAYNKDLKNGKQICKVLVNYKWSVKHLQAVDKKYADNAIEQFNAIIKQFGVKLDAPKAKKEQGEKKAQA